MLSWPAGVHAKDGVWASHWYGQVVASTGFAAPGQSAVQLPPDIKAVSDACQDDYEAMARHRIGVT